MNFKQSSPAAFGGPHLFGKCGALAYAIREAEAVTLLRAAALNERETTTSRSQTRRLNKEYGLAAVETRVSARLGRAGEIQAF